MNVGFAGAKTFQILKNLEFFLKKDGNFVKME